MTGRRSILAALLMVAVAAIAPAASAAQATRPIHTPNDGSTVELRCDHLGPLTAQYATAGEWVHAAEPRLIVDSTLVLVAYAFDYVYTPNSGPLEHVAGAKPAPRNQRLDHCVMTIEDDQGVFVANYWVSYTPLR